MKRTHPELMEQMRVKTNRYIIKLLVLTNMCLFPQRLHSEPFFFVISFQEKRLSDLSNQSHDSQVSNSTLSAASHEDRLNAAANTQREDLVDGHSPQDEDELDEMEVEYIEVIITWT